MPEKIRKIMGNMDLSAAEEIRLRAERPVLVYAGGEEINAGGEVSLADLQELTEILSDYSPYAFEESLKQGYLTLRGGHRAGFCGKPFVSGGEIRAMREITGVNIRVAREARGCAEKISAYALEPRPRNFMIISPPGRGKTTLLRDLTRIAGDSGLNVCIADERGEIAGGGALDVGIRTDVMEGCPKAVAMMGMLRAMSPHVIAADEIGCRADVLAIEEAAAAGAAVFCTVHADSVAGARKRPVLAELFESGVFGRFAVIEGSGRTGRVEGVYGEGGRALC
jgi:stage III sporulation protein AA